MTQVRALFTCGTNGTLQRMRSAGSWVRGLAIAVMTLVLLAGVSNLSAASRRHGKRHRVKPSARAARSTPRRGHKPPPPRKERPTPIEGDNAALRIMAYGFFDAMEYEKVLPVARQLLERMNVDIDTRLEIYWLQGSSLAIVGDPVEAEKPFRFLLQARTVCAIAIASRVCQDPRQRRRKLP